jgi:hypothetical protein
MMEIKLKKRLLPNLTLPTMKNREVHTRITGITSGNAAGISVQPVAYERSRAYLAHLAEVEIKRSLALAEAYRLSLR